MTNSEVNRASQSRHLAEEPVLSPSAIHALDEGTALILFGHLSPLLAYLPGLWERDDAEQSLHEELVAKSANDLARTAQSITPNEIPSIRTEAS